MREMYLPTLDVEFDTDLTVVQVSLEHEIKIFTCQTLAHACLQNVRLGSRSYFNVLRFDGSVDLAFGYNMLRVSIGKVPATVSRVRQFPVARFSSIGRV